MKTILFIDDNFETRLFIRLVLEKEGYRPILAKNGAEGIQFAITESPDLILCDYYLPDKNGLTIYRELSASEATNFIPFVFLSGEIIEDVMDDTDIKKIHQIRKPFSIENFLDVIKSIIL